jgi:hypothetical protein
MKPPGKWLYARLTWMGFRLLFWQRWTCGIYDRLSLFLKQSNILNFQKRRNARHCSTASICLYVSLPIRDLEAQVMACERSINSKGNFVLLKRMYLRMLSFSHVTSGAVNRKLGLRRYDSGRCFGLNLFSWLPRSLSVLLSTKNWMTINTDIYAVVSCTSLEMSPNIIDVLPYTPIMWLPPQISASSARWQGIGR